MTPKELNSKMFEYTKKFDELYSCIINDVDEFIKTNPEKSFYPFQAQECDKFIDHICLSGAWIRDRIEGRTALPGNKDYRGSLTAKIRRALGFSM